MREAWRILKEKYAETAFSGEGAFETGGRWNSRGTPVVYTSGSQSLAVLETLVHLNPPVPFSYVAFRIRFDPARVEEIPRKDLPIDWRTEPPPSSTQAIGDTWVREGRSAVLALPSVIIPEELNYLLNPGHTDFKRLSIAKPEPFVFDPRLLT